MDVGAGSREFLFVMSELGKTGLGVEPNEGYATYCREELGLDVRTEEISDDLFGEGAFDLIRLNHVVEHLADPVGQLRRVARWLSGDGVLFVEVPNIEVYCRVKSRGGMFHYGHIFNHSPWTLRAAAGLAGLAEDPRAAEACAGVTGAVFRRGAPIAPEAVRNATNAAHVAALIERHYGEGFDERRPWRPLEKLGRRIEETISAARAGRPKEIGREVAADLGMEHDG